MDSENPYINLCDTVAIKPPVNDCRVSALEKQLGAAQSMVFIVSDRLEAARNQINEAIEELNRS